MSPLLSPQPDGSQPTYRRLKLVVSTPEHPHLLDSHHPIDNPTKEQSSRSSSPARPSYSPVTPTLSHSSATGHDTAEPEWVDEPAPLPISLDENSDAIALQATISLLQMQRQQSLRDIRILNRMKQEALEDPKAFVDALQNGDLSQATSNRVHLEADDETSDDDDERLMKQDASRFGKLPRGQNVARFPPIEWSKYRIVGESLDRLHEFQQQYPGMSEEASASGYLPQSHEVAAPYRPFTDRLNPLTSSTEKRNYDR